MSRRPTETGFDPDFAGELAREAYSAAAGHSSAPGPVQLNLAFREPLSGPIGELPVRGRAASSRAEQRRRAIEPGSVRDVARVSTHCRGEVSTSSTTGWVRLRNVARGTREHRRRRRARRRRTRRGGRAGTRRTAARRGLQRRPLRPEPRRRLPPAARRRALRRPHRARDRVRASDPQPRGSRADRSATGVETIVVRGPSPVDYNPGHRVARFVDAVEVDRTSRTTTGPGSAAGCTRAGSCSRSARRCSSYEQSVPAMAISADAGRSASR